MPERNAFLGITVPYVILSHLIFVVSVLTRRFDFLLQFIAEDSYSEAIGASSLFLAALICLYAFWQAGGRTPKIPALRRWALLALAGIFAFGAGEEVSWGQRLIGFATPDVIEAINVQGEFTLHNIEAFGINAVSLTRRLFHIFWFTLTVIIPVAAALSRRVRAALGRLMPVPPWWVGVPFVLNYALLRASMLATRATYQSYHYALNEIQEGVFEVLFLALAILLAHLILSPRQSTTARLATQRF